MSSKGKLVTFSLGKMLLFASCKKKKKCHQKIPLVHSEKESHVEASISPRGTASDGGDAQEQRCSKSRGLNCPAQGNKLDCLYHQFTLVTTHGRGQKERL